MAELAHGQRVETKLQRRAFDQIVVQIGGLQFPVRTGFVIDNPDCLPGETGRVILREHQIDLAVQLKLNELVAAIDISGGDGVTYYWPQARLRIDGDIAASGGGLPNAQIHLRQPRNGGPLSGTATIAPYAAGGARIALAPVTFAARRDGWTQVSTVALLDGPFGGGRVTGLRIPVDGRFGAGGGLVFGQGCIEARFATLQLGGLRLGATRLPLCPTGPAILYRRAGSPLQFGVATRNVSMCRSRASSRRRTFRRRAGEGADAAPAASATGCAENHHDNASRMGRRSHRRRDFLAGRRKARKVVSRQWRNTALS